MRAHPPAVLHMRVHMQYIKRCNVRRKRAQARSAGFLLRLAQGNGEEVCIPIRMAARPRPNAALDMVRHQRFVSRRIHHKRRACDVCNAVFPCEHCIREPQRIVQNHSLLLCLTRIRRHIGRKLRKKIRLHAPPSWNFIDLS